MLDYIREKIAPVDLIGTITKYDDEHDVARAFTLYTNATKNNVNATSYDLLESLNLIYSNAETKELKDATYKAMNVAFTNMLVNTFISTVSLNNYTVCGLKTAIGCCLDKEYTQLQSCNSIILSLEDVGGINVTIAPENATAYVVVDTSDALEACVVCTMLSLNNICNKIFSTHKLHAYSSSFNTNKLWSLVTDKDIENCICGIVRTKDIQKICNVYNKTYRVYED